MTKIISKKSNTGSEDPNGETPTMISERLALEGSKAAKAALIGKSLNICLHIRQNSLRIGNFKMKLQDLELHTPTQRPRQEKATASIIRSIQESGLQRPKYPILALIRSEEMQSPDNPISVNISSPALSGEPQEFLSLQSKARVIAGQHRIEALQLLCRKKTTLRNSDGSIHKLSNDDSWWYVDLYDEGVFSRFNLLLVC